VNTVKTAALAVSITGAVTIVTALIVLLVPGAIPGPAEPDHPAGFTDTLLWFELAKDADEVFANLGPADDPVGMERREKLDRVNRLDFAFLIAYSSFNGALVILVWALNRGNAFGKSLAAVGAGSIFAALMLVGDVLENIQLLRLTGYADPREVPVGVVRELNVWTRVKWGAIFANTALLGAGFGLAFSEKKRLAIPVVLVMGAAAAIGFLSIGADAYRNYLELAALLLVPIWFGCWIAGMAILIRPQES
jgi:hypothetical protein